MGTRMARFMFEQQDQGCNPKQDEKFLRCPEVSIRASDIRSGATLHTDNDEIFKRWPEHFDGVPNRPSSIHEKAIHKLPHVAVDTSPGDLPSSEDTT
jgi:hypothetical protein